MNTNEEEQRRFEASDAYEIAERGAAETGRPWLLGGHSHLDLSPGILADSIRKVLREHYLVCVCWPLDGTGLATPLCVCKLDLGHYPGNNQAVDGWISHLIAEMAKAGVQLS